MTDPAPAAAPPVASPFGLVPEPEDCFTGRNWVDPGAFAIYGSAAFFGGISRLHLTVPVIFMEISGQTRLLLPIMLACKVASVTADWLHPHSLFHAIIEFKGLYIDNRRFSLSFSVTSLLVGEEASESEEAA